MLHNPLDKNVITWCTEKKEKIQSSSNIFHFENVAIVTSFIHLWVFLCLAYDIFNSLFTVILQIFVVFIINHLIFHFFEYLSHLAVLFTQGRRELSAVVHCYGGGSCKITINSATTAGEVRDLRKEWSGILCKSVMHTGRVSSSMARFTFLRVQSQRQCLLQK